MTKDQLYDLFFIYSVDLERSSEKGEKSGGVLNQVIIDAFDDEEKGMEFLNHAIDQMEEELYWDEFVSKATELRQNGKLYDTFHSRFIKDETRDIILPVGKHLYSGIHSSSKPTIKSIRSYKIIKIIKNNARAVCTCTSASARATSTLSPKRPPTPLQRSSNT